MNKLSLHAVVSLFLMVSMSMAKDYKGAEYRTKESYVYGRFEVRYKPPKGNGLLASFFTYHELSSSSEWNEIDFEILGRYEHDVLVTSIAPGQRFRNSHQWAPFNTHDDFHNYAFEWTPDYIAWFIDNKEVYRQTQEHIKEFIYDQKIMMNIWPPDIIDWVGPFDDRVLPVFAYYDWVSYASYTPGSGNTGTDNNFTLQWKDDFDSWDQNRWEKATHTWGGNLSDFVPENVVFKDGYLILCLTKDSPRGYVDSSPPAVLWTRSLQDTVTIFFSEELEPTSAQNPSSYLISGVSISQARLLPDHRTVELIATGLNPGNSYNLVILGVKDNSASKNMLLGQVIPLQFSQPLSLPIKINIGGKAYANYLADQVWQPDLEYGHLDGYITEWPTNINIIGAEDDTVYWSELHEIVEYKIRVPNGRYKITLLMAENKFTERGMRIFDIIIEENRVASELDVYKEAGTNKAYQIVADNIEVKDELIDIHFTNLWYFSLLNGLIVEKAGPSQIKSNSEASPDNFCLRQNYPNPFNQSTMIEFTLPEPCLVTLELYDLLGQKIRSLMHERKAAGTHRMKIDGTDLAAGIYFYSLGAGCFNATKKFLLLK